MLQILKWNRK